MLDTGSSARSRWPSSPVDPGLQDGAPTAEAEAEAAGAVTLSAPTVRRRLLQAGPGPGVELVPVVNLKASSRHHYYVAFKLDS
jgi:hypothetical protein